MSAATHYAERVVRRAPRTPVRVWAWFLFVPAVLFAIARLS
jgi:hypothetical protein